MRARLIDRHGHFVGEGFKFETTASYDKHADRNVVKLFYGALCVRVWFRPKNDTYDFLAALYATAHFFEALNGFVVLQREKVQL